MRLGHWTAAGIDLKWGAPPARCMTDADDSGDDEDVAKITLCSDCEQEEEHDVLRSVERGQGVDLLVRCHACGNVHTLELRPPRSIAVRFTLSEGAHSLRTEIEVDEDEMFEVGDCFDHGEASWEVTRLEAKGGLSLTTGDPSEIDMVWAVRADKVRVKLTFTEGGRSWSDSIVCEPDEVFTCGSFFSHEGERWKIRALHSGQGRKLTGKLPAGRVRRVFLHKPLTRSEVAEREQVARGRWRGQEYPGREERMRGVFESNLREP